MIKKYIKDTGNLLVFCAHIEPNMATFKFYSPTEEDSLKLHYTFSNLEVQLNYVLKGQ